MTPARSVAALATRIPRDDYARPAALRADALRLDGNEGSVPDPALLAGLATAGPGLLRDYPSTEALQNTLAARFATAPEQVVITAGADDALDRVCRAFLEPGRSVVLPVPTFEMLHRFVETAGGTALEVAWNGGFPTDAVIATVRDDTALVVVVSPNNPTGAVIGRDELRRLAAAVPDRPILLDHAYVEYADEDLTATALALPNVIVVRTLAKAWGLAGCRVGYALASPEIAGVVRRAGNPYPVSALSLAVARVAVEGGEAAMADHVASVREERRRVRELLEARGIPTPPSQGNFLCPDFGPRAEFASRALQWAGIVTRRFPHRRGLETRIRMSMPADREGLRRLEAALELTLAPEILLLDLDGTFADVRGSYRRCIRETAAAFGGHVTTGEVEAAVRAGDANNDWELTRRLLAAQGIVVPLDRVTERFQALYLGTDATPGHRAEERLLTTREVLGALRRNRRTAVVTGRPRAEAEWFLRRERVENLFDALVCLEDAPLKPDPAPVRRALEALGGGRAWTVGDTPDDVRAAGGGGVLPIGVVPPGDDPEATRSALSAAGAVVVLPTLDHLLEILP